MRRVTYHVIETFGGLHLLAGGLITRHLLTCRQLNDNRLFAYLVGTSATVEYGGL